MRSGQRATSGAGEATPPAWDGDLHFTPAAREGVLRHLERARAKASGDSEPPAALLVTLEEEGKGPPDLRLVPARSASPAWARLELADFTVFLRGAGVDRLRGGTVEYVAEPEAGFRFRIDDEGRTAHAENDLPDSRNDDAALAGAVDEALEETVNPMVAAHGGAISLVAVRDRVAEIEMEGGCQGCSAARATLRSIVERALRAAVPGLCEVRDVTDHEAGDNPYFSA